MLESVEESFQKTKTAKSKEYITWFHNFLSNYPTFIDDTICCDNNLSEETKYYVSIISYLQSIISNYYATIRIDEEEISVLKNKFTNSIANITSSEFPKSVVSVNFECFSAKLITVIGQGSYTSVNLIEKGTGLCDFKDVLDLENILSSYHEKESPTLSDILYIEDLLNTHRKKIITKIINFKV